MMKKRRSTSVRCLTNYAEWIISESPNWKWLEHLPDDTQIDEWKMKINDKHSLDVIDEINEMVRIDSIVGNDSDD